MFNRGLRFVRPLSIAITLLLLGAACSSDGGDAGAVETIEPMETVAPTEASPPAELTKVRFQLDWSPNTNHTGIFVADEMGWYAQEGIELEILPYSGGNGDLLVTEGVADFAVSFHNSVALSAPAGVPLKIVAAVVQKTVEAIGVTADRDDIQSPKDLDGMIYAGFGGPFEVPVMKAVIQADGGAGEFDSVVLDTWAYQAVYNGDADFVIPFLTWEGIEAELHDQPMKYFHFSDYGMPEQYTVVMVAGETWLAENPDLAAAFLRATKRGFEWGAANPDEASQILIDANEGIFNDPELVFRSQRMLSDGYFLDSDGNWGTIDPNRFGAYSGFLFDSGIVAGPDGAVLTTEPDWASYIDMVPLTGSAAVAVPPAELTKVNFQLDWSPNTNHTGIFVADEMGWYAQEGIELEILPYSGGNGDLLVTEGVADFAVSFHNSVALSAPAGVPLKIVAAVVQKTVEAIGVTADRDDIQSPKDLDGMIYAGFGGPFEVPVMKAVIQADGGAGEFDSVVLDTWAYQAVYNGDADFVIPFLTWEGIEAELHDQPMKYFHFSDYGMPEQYTVVMVAGETWLAENPDLAAAFLRATKRGFEWGAANPDEASQILIDANEGIFNDPELVFRSQRMLSDGYFLDSDGNWGTIDPNRFGAYSGFLFDSGIVAGPDGAVLTTEPDWASYIDMSYLIR